METLICGIRWVFWSATRNHGTRRGVPERTVAGECQCWQGLPDIVDRVGDQDCCVRRGQWNTISGAVPVATIMDHAPELVKATLCQSPLDQRRSAEALKCCTREASYVLPGLFQSQLSMHAK